MLLSPLGNCTFTRLWLKSRPKVMLCRLSGNCAPTRLWLKASPKVMLFRPSGNVTGVMPCLKRKLTACCKPRGSGTRAASLWLKSRPNSMLLRLSGKTTFSRGWLKASPKTILVRPLGKFAFSRLWLNRLLKARLRRPLGSAMLDRSSTSARLSTHSQTCHPSSPGTTPRRTAWTTLRSCSTLIATTRHWMRAPAVTCFPMGVLSDRVCVPCNNLTMPRGFPSRTRASCTSSRPMTAAVTVTHPKLSPLSAMRSRSRSLRSLRSPRASAAASSAAMGHNGRSTPEGASSARAGCPQRRRLKT
mmetsp:Transcript_10654/g.33765  ORF Transcript_10654/g.33765 Transcript_10654/m.33765 type:complete len:302 (+) Transcript_10654:525-1430(+)